MSPRRRALWGLPVALLLAYLAGFAWFLRQADRTAPPLPAHADAIVVLTGGPDRVETGLRLLLAGRAPILLVSGLGGGATEADLARRAGLDPAALAGRVILGRKATSTRTNADETASFVAAHQVRTLILVTSAYHMPRALLELGRALPDVTLHPAPVPMARDGGRATSWRLLAEEYTKWLLTLVGASRFAPAHPAPAPGHGRDTRAGDRLGA